MLRFVSFVVISIFIMCAIVACRDNAYVKISNYKFNKPFYDGVELVVSNDTLHLPLNKTTDNNSVESICPFSDHGIQYVAIYNGPSETINFYEFYSQKLIKTLSLARYLVHRKHTTSVYCKNFDSIFIRNNKTSLFITDSSGINRSTIYFSENSRSEVADFKLTRPPVLKDSCFYASVPSSGKMRTIGKVKDWQLINQLDFKNNKIESFYRLPERYMNKLYDYYFLDYSYCFNDRGFFVFSFPADPNLYETDFAEVNTAFYGRSQFQQGDIEPVNKNKKDYDPYIEYMLRDSYGAVFFDPYHKKYVRVFKRKISKDNLAASKYNREKSILIFNKDLQIIGESLLPKGFLINSLFFTSDGRMYARTKQKDTTALHFLRLMYKEKTSDSTSLAKIRTK